MTTQQTHGDRLTAHQDQPSGGQTLSAVVGTTYLVVGLWGFAVTGSVDFTGHDPASNIAGLTVNPLHNVLHVVAGALGIGAYAAAGLARIYGIVLFLGFGALCVWGLLASGEPHALNLDRAGDVVHGVTALLGALIALLPVRRHRTDSAFGER